MLGVVVSLTRSQSYFTKTNLCAISTLEAEGELMRKMKGQS